MAKVAVGLVHYPVLDRTGKVVATNITNYDIHDIARAARTYGVERYYLIHPMQEQQMFVARILEHWCVGEGVKFNPMRKTALTDVYVASSVDDAIKDWGVQPQLVATSARATSKAISFREFRRCLEKVQDGPYDAAHYLLLFGTGLGLTPELIERCDYLLEPIRGASSDDYRHLSVRSAVSICLDRLLSR